MQSEQLRGCHVAIVTPFLQNGELDEQSLHDLVNWQIACGTDGIIVCGTTGESVTLSDQEYTRTVTTVVETANGRVPVVAGAGSNNTRHAIQLSKLAAKAGADAVLSVAPYYNKPTQDGLFAHFQQIAENSPLPVVLYNVPGRTSSNLRAATTLRLAALKNVVAIKEASGDFSQIMEILRRRPRGFAVLSGDDALTLPMIACGADGVISVISNEIPQAFRDLVHAALRGDFETARLLQNRYLRLMELNFIESNPVPVKAALAMLGRTQETVRLPLVPMRAENRALLAAELRNLNLIGTETEHTSALPILN